MTRHEQIVALARKGLDDETIAEQVGCRREYVRVARRRARVRAQGEDGKTGGSKFQRIVELYHRGLADTAIATEVGCRREYVRVARRRAGLFRAPSRSAADSPAAEAELRRKIADLTRRLAEAELALAGLEHAKAASASPAHPTRGPIPARRRRGAAATAT